MSKSYNILPNTFRKISEDKYVIVNSCGDYYFLAPYSLEKYLTYKLPTSDCIYQDLESRHFLCDDDEELAINLSAVKYRTRKGFLKNFTALHMMVITVRCNQKCEYCQVSCESDDAFQFDMSPETARSVIDFIFCTPSQSIKIEFQGGEPLLNWKTITAAVEYACDINGKIKKDVSFVVCTNLTHLTQEKSDFIKHYKIDISTSLDGPCFLHDSNRKLRSGKSSYEIFADKLCLAKNNNIPVSALMTTTRHSLPFFKEIVDEYIDNGFSGLFFRALNPYGFAFEKISELGYQPEEFVEFYKNGLDYIIDINRNGTYFVEYYTQLLLTRILTSFPTGFVDLQSPAGTGICGVIYDYNGDVYPSDEGRMLSRMGDSFFYLGNVLKNSYREIFTGDKIKLIISKSCVETTPLCAWCAYQLYCGVDPVRNYLETKDIVGFRPNSFFCKQHQGMFDVLFNKIAGADDELLDIFWSWITKS